MPTTIAEALTSQINSLKTLSDDVSLTGSKKTLIIVPAYNEEKSIERVLTGIKQEVPDIPVLVINDGSADRTLSIALKCGAKVISLPYNSGYGVALQTGFIYALQNGFSTIIQMDGDGQHDPKYIRTLLEEIEKSDVDVVIGSRFRGKCKYKTTFSKRVGMYFFGALATLITGQRVTDPTSGFQALKGDAVRFFASDFYPPDYPDADFIILLHRAGFKVREVPVTMHPNTENKSMHRGHMALYYIFKMFLSIIVTLLRQKPGR